MGWILSFVGFGIAELAIWIHIFVRVEGSPGNKLMTILGGKVEFDSRTVYELCISGLFFGVGIFFLCFFTLLLFEICVLREDASVKRTGGAQWDS